MRYMYMLCRGFGFGLNGLSFITFWRAADYTVMGGGSSENLFAFSFTVSRLAHDIDKFIEVLVAMLI